jgi:hypothetical protein
MLDPGPAEFAAILAATGWPRITFGRRVVEGEAAWRSVTPSPANRRAVLARLGRRELLVATPEARGRLRAWLDAIAAQKALPREDGGGMAKNRPGPDAPVTLTELGIDKKLSLSSEAIRARLAFFGDSSFIPIIVAGLQRAPAPVLEAVLDEAVFLGVGRDCGAWTMANHFYGPDGKPRHRVVNLGPNTTQWLVLHESRHVFDSPRVAEGKQPLPAISADGEAGLHRWAVAEGFHDQMERRTELLELLANSSATAWSIS